MIHNEIDRQATYLGEIDKIQDMVRLALKGEEPCSTRLYNKVESSLNAGAFNALAHELSLMKRRVYNDYN